jgi:hypothetical protein
MESERRKYGIEDEIKVNCTVWGAPPKHWAYQRRIKNLIYRLVGPTYAHCSVPSAI